MLINEMTKQECREVLAHASFGRLGCSLGDQPYIVPVCLAYPPMVLGLNARAPFVRPIQICESPKLSLFTSEA
jgi:nitroimidazol reductase NimA-like FMN-containing flavoprotein (pyridoxamine 5'-phosphate oxidase superfamily)